MKTTADPVKVQLARAIELRLKRSGISKSELARRMGTSRAVVHRLTLPDDTSLTLNTMLSAADALNCQLRITLR